MKCYVPLLAVLCIFLVISTCAGQTTMLKHDFSQKGVSLILPTDANYLTELQQLGFADNPDEELQRPASVVIKNTSQRTVIAFGVSWTKRHLRTGAIAPSNVSCSQPYGLLDGTRHHFSGPLEGTIPPGSSRLVTVAGMVQTARDLRNKIVDLREWTFEEVRLDSIVFDDGEAFGPDHLEVIKRLKTRVDALQDLTQEMSDRLSRGEQLHAIVEELTSHSRSDESTLSPLNPGDVAELVRQQYLEELATTAKNFGNEAALGRLRQLKYTTRPTIRWAGGPGKKIHGGPFKPAFGLSGARRP